MTKAVSLEEVWQRLLPYQDLQDRCHNARIYPTASGIPFDQNEMEQFSDLVLFQCAQKPNSNPYHIAKKIKSYWPNRSSLSLASRVYDYQSTHYDKIVQMQIMHQQWEVLGSLNNLFHSNNLIHSDEIVLTACM